MISVRQIAEELVAREGGRCFDASSDTCPSARTAPVDDAAVDGILREYFEKPRISALPDVLQANVFDMYLNAGDVAIRILQRLLCDMDEKVVVDGVLGPQSIAAAHRAHAAADGYLADAYGIARRNYYFRLADRSLSRRHFAETPDGGKGGWIRRAEAFIAPRYHLDDRQFRRRVASWT
ncbi:putative peptidoglycan-binding domain-containing protein [Sulfitobacter sp. LCG007]